TDASDQFVDLLGPASLDGGITIRQDDVELERALRQLNITIRDVMGYPRLVKASETDEQAGLGLSILHFKPHFIRALRLDLATCFRQKRREFFKLRFPCISVHAWRCELCKFLAEQDHAKHVLEEHAFLFGEFDELDEF